MPGDDVGDLVITFRARDEFTPVAENVRSQLGDFGQEAQEAGRRTEEATTSATRGFTGMATGLRSVSFLLREVGLTGVAEMTRLASHAIHVVHALERVSSLARGAGAAVGATEAVGGAAVGEGALVAGAGGAAATGIGLPIAAGLLVGAAIGAIGSSLLSKPAGSTANTNIVVNVDAQGTATDHRALAQMVAREVEASAGTRSRLPEEAF